jgi:hypothetical protein
MAAWKRSPEAGYSGWFTGYFRSTVHLGPMCKLWDRAPWKGKSKLRFLSRATPGETEEHKIHEERGYHSHGQANFKGEIYARGRCRNPLAKGERAVLGRDRQVFPWTYTWGY